jgi:hypothetical protein
VGILWHLAELIILGLLLAALVITVIGFFEKKKA